MIEKKTNNDFLNLFEERCKMLGSSNKFEIEFKKEMARFLPVNNLEYVQKTLVYGRLLFKF